MSNQADIGATTNSKQSQHDESFNDTEALKTEGQINEQFQECLRIISEEGNRQRLIMELEKEENFLLSSDIDSVNRVKLHIIEYMSEVLTYIDLSKIVTSSDQLVDFFCGNEFQKNFTQTMTSCLQFIADRMHGSDQMVESRVVDDWKQRLLESVKSRDFASLVFESWTSKRESEKLFENISTLYDNKVTKGNPEAGTPWKKVQRALRIDIKDLMYTIAIFAKCTMSLSQEDLDKIMPTVIKRLEAQKPEAFSKDSMSSFFKAVRTELESISNQLITSRRTRSR